jgi:uncharacterized membrane protein
MHAIFNLFGGLFLILFLPGYLFTLLFFESKEINIVERIGISFASSIAILPLGVFYSTLLGIPINIVSISQQVIIIVSTLGVFFFIKYLIKSK